MLLISACYILPSINLLRNGCLTSNWLKQYESEFLKHVADVKSSFDVSIIENCLFSLADQEGGNFKIFTR